MATLPELVAVIHNPEHYNPRCGCTIPATWEAHVLVREAPGQRSQIVRVFGMSRRDALDTARNEHPTLTEYGK